VNASSIEFSTSTSGIWDYGDWQSARNTVNGKEITCTVTPTFAEGSDNHILWRAKDQVGNGYHLSENYQIKIKINHPPEVTLLTPENNSIINILTPELIWLGSDLDNDTELSYDIYLSKNKDNILTLNSSAFISTNINNSRYRFVVPLEDGEIYYWTVVPNDGTLNGTCLSSYNKFKIDTSIELPVVKLLNPKDKSNVTTNTPKLSWKLTYSNPDVVTYNIYYAKSPEQSNLISNEFLYEKNYKLTSFILDKPLTPGERYYWTIIPTVSLSDGKLHGICSSGIWSFYVELPKENIFSLDMMIQDQQLSIVQGNYSSTNITIINKGNTEDTVYVYVEKGILNANVALERSSAPFQLNLSEAIQLKLEILVFETAKPQNYTLSITAVSNNAAIERKEVSVTKSLQLQVIEKEIEPPIEEEVKGKEKSDEIDYFLWSVLIIIIILILALFLFVYKSRKIPYVKSEVLYKPSGRLRLALPGVSGKAEEGEVLPPADEETVISLEGKTIPVTYQLPRAVLTKEQELKLLRERFLLRDISEETYKEMKTEIESSEDIDITGLESSEQDTEEPVDEIPEDVEEPLMEEPDLGIGEEIPADVGKLEELEEGEGDLSIEEEAVVESPVDEDADKISETKSKKKAKKLKRKKDKEQIEGPVEEPVAEDEFHDTQEEVHPFPRDGLCKTCGESMDPDMAYCWSCGTKYKVK
jgi:hypothetical protein